MGASLVCLLWGISDLGGKISNLGGGISLQKTGNAVADVNGELLVSQWDGQGPLISCGLAHSG